MLKLMVKFSHCDLQICILILCGSYLFCQCCVCRLQLPHLLLEAVGLQSLDLLQIKKIEGVICRSGQLCFSHTSFKVGCFQHALMSNSPGSICLVVDWQVRNWSDVQACRVSLTELCERHATGLDVAPVSYLPIHHQADGPWRVRHQLMLETSDFGRSVTEAQLATTADYALNLFNLHKSRD